MDHNNSEKKHYMCSHGMCNNHDPEWENIGGTFLVPYRWFFSNKTCQRIEKYCEKKLSSLSLCQWFLGSETYWQKKCCGERLSRYKRVQKQKCKKCGRVRNLVLHKEIGLCKCCGYRRDMSDMIWFRGLHKGGHNTRPETPRPKHPCGHSPKCPQS